MMEKRIVLLVLSLCILLLSGCGKVIELTDEETRLIAEYSADLLLKYDINYVDRIKEGNQKLEELAAEELDNEENEQPKKEESTEMTTEESTTGDGDKDEDFTEQADVEETTQIIEDIADVIDLDGVSVKFQEYLIVNQYPESNEQEGFINLESTDGYQLLVLKFEVMNETDEMISLSMIDKKLDYRIVCNGNHTANAMLTILMEDLGTLETVIESKTAQEAVLIFQLSDEMKDQLETMDLYVKHNEKDNIMHILQ